MPEKYGSFEWLENIFKSNDDDPWGHNFRGIELYRYDQIIKMIKRHCFKEAKVNKEFKVLDIGCATGDFTSRVYELNKNLVAIDASKTAIDKARTKFNYIDFRVGSLPNASSEKNTFDLITCLEVLYYMDEDVKRNFLCEMKSLLKKDGRGIITSVIGEKPYFSSKELVKLLSEYFEIKAIEYYGSKWYSKFDSILFKKHYQINKIQRLLKLNCEDLKREFENSNHPKRRMIEDAISFITELEGFKSITYVILKAMKKMIRMALGFKLPAKIFHFLSRKLSLEPTHTFVLVAKHRG